MNSYLERSNDWAMAILMWAADVMIVGMMLAIVFGALYFAIYPPAEKPAPAATTCCACMCGPRVERDP